MSAKRRKSTKGETAPGTEEAKGAAKPKEAGKAKGTKAPKRTRTPTGEDRVLLFADSLQEDREEGDEQQREWETWVTCRLAEETFAVPVRHVQEILRVTDLTRVPHAPFPVRGVMNLRGYVLPVVDLRIRLGLPEGEIGEAHRVMVIASRGRLVGLLVDAVEQVVQVDRLSIEEPPEDVMTEQSYYLVGVYHRGEELLILLEPDRVLQVREVDDDARKRGR